MGSTLSSSIRLAVCTLAFNEEQTIGAVIKNWRDIADKHLVIINRESWHGGYKQVDRTGEIAESLGAEVVYTDAKSEHEQRNEALELLREYDYVLIVDADELYLDKDRQKIIDTLGTGEVTDAYRASRVLTYWKSTKYRLDPEDTHEPTIAVDPKRRKFVEHRNIDSGQAVPIGVCMHHLSYIKDDDRMLQKIQSYEHYDLIKENWYNDVWLSWHKDMDDIRPYGNMKSKAIYAAFPAQLADLLQ